MKILYLDCNMGAAGDMLCAALLELLPDREAFLHKLNHLGIPGVEYECVPSVKAGITGSRIVVKVYGEEEGCDHDHHHDHHHHHHAGMDDIAGIVYSLPIADQVKQNVMGVYELIAEAESAAHGVPVTEIHFHEVGTMDAIADITAVCMMVEELMPDKIYASAIRTGNGSVRCAHGILPVPAPATAYILKGVPIYSGEITGELCTPTGAALLKFFVDSFEGIPAMIPEKIGYGMGQKEFETANCVRAVLGTSVTAKADVVVKLSCNVDDMTGEEIGFAMDRLFAGGAKEVFTVPVGMKKSRPGMMIVVLCDEKDREEMLHLLFMHTTTIGVREEEVKRNTLERREQTIETPYGPVRKKVSTGFGVTREKYEYDDLARVAAEEGCSIREVEEICRDAEG